MTAPPRGLLTGALAACPDQASGVCGEPSTGAGSAPGDGSAGRADPALDEAGDPRDAGAGAVQMGLHLLEHRALAARHGDEDGPLRAEGWMGERLPDQPGDDVRRQADELGTDVDDDPVRFL